MTPDDMEGRLAKFADWLDSRMDKLCPLSAPKAAAELRALLLDYQERGRALEDILDVSERMNPDQRFNASGRLARCAQHARATLKGKSHD
jgi:hypothetical protein